MPGPVITALCILYHLLFPRQLVKNPPAMWETWVRSLGWEDPLEKGMATHSSIQAWRIHGVYSVQSLSCVRLLVIPWTAACQASLSITNSRSLIKLMSIEYVMPSNHFILCHPLLLLPSSFPASGSFQMSQLFASGDQSIGVSASTSVLPINTQD